MKRRQRERRGRQRESLVVVVEVEVVEVAIEKNAEIGTRIRRWPPSHAACERQTPLASVMRPCALHEKGRAWRRRESFGARQPFKGGETRISKWAKFLGKLFFSKSTLFFFSSAASI